MIKKQWQTAIDYLCQLEATIEGDSYHDIVWVNEIPLYTEAELMEKYNEVKRELLPWQDMIAERNRLLQECDWTQSRDIPAETSELWTSYRQQLRDLPDTIDPWIEDVIWPIKPA